MSKILTEELIQNFGKFLVEEEKSDATYEKYMRDVTTFYHWARCRQLDKLTILEYKNNLIKKYAPASVNSVLSSLNALFDFCGWVDLKVKMLKIQKQIFAKRDKELTKEEYQRLLKVSKTQKNERLYYLMQTICSCGIRVSELEFITTDAIRAGRVNINCKGKMRVVMLPNKLCKMLKGYVKRKSIPNGPVFITRSGKPLDRSAIWKMMKALCEMAGVSKIKVFPHNLRHLFARTYYAIQKDIVRLADVLGHSSINTTRIYTMEAV